MIQPIEPSSLSVDHFMADPITDKTILLSKPDNIRHIFEVFIMKHQKKFCQALEKFELDACPANPSKFIADKWSRPEGGGGITCVLQDGKIFEKAGVNISVVHGHLSNRAVTQMKQQHKNLELEEDRSLPFFAAGISSVIHPCNPHIPTVHFNYRYFEVEGKNASDYNYSIGNLN